MFAAARRGHLPSCIGILNIDSDSPRVAVIIFVCVDKSVDFLLEMAVSELAHYGNDVHWRYRAVDQLRHLSQLDADVFHNRRAALDPIQAYSSPRESSDGKHSHAVKKTLLFQFNIVIPMLNLVVSVTLVAIPIYLRPVETAIGVGLLASGFVIYYVLVRTKRAPKFLHQLNGILCIRCSCPKYRLTQNLPCLHARNFSLEFPNHLHRPLEFDKEEMRCSTAHQKIPTSINKNTDFCIERIFLVL